MARIGFDHCFQFIEKAQAYFGLRDRGFNAEDIKVTHPGARDCRFLSLKSQDYVSGPGRSHYLEFVHAREVDEYRRYQASLGEPTDDHTLFMPGFSLSMGADLERFYDENKAAWSQYGIKFLHRNYNWNSPEKLPGWNFVTFSKNIFPGIYLWITEYEPRPGKKPEGEELLSPNHPNSCSGVAGFIWRAEPKGFENLSALTGRAFDGTSLLLDDGLKIWSEKPGSEIAARFQNRKKHPFWAVVLRCADFEKFRSVSLPEETFLFQGKRAALIKFSDQAWDIIVVSEN